MNIDIMAMRLVEMAKAGRTVWISEKDFLNDFPNGGEAMKAGLAAKVAQLGWSLRPAKIEHEHMTSLGMVSGQLSGVKLVRL